MHGPSKPLIGIVLASLLAAVLCAAGFAMGGSASHDTVVEGAVASKSSALADTEQRQQQQQPEVPVKPPRPPKPEKPYESCEAVDWDFAPTGDPEEFYFDVAARGDEQETVDAGGIVAWQDKWYCSHDWSEGWRFFDLEPGDVVHIDGMDVKIKGRAFFALHETVGKIRGALGTDKVLFQTCMPSHTEIVVYYGTAEGSPSI